MKIRIKKILKITLLYVLVPIVLVVVGAVGASRYIIDFAKSAYDNSNWMDVDGKGIEEEGFVTLGGLDQFVRIRGRDRSNPVLLDLHGGPGYNQSEFSHRFYRPLTEYFTLVEWDQRGCGRSTGDATLASTMSYQRMVDDAVELIEHLKIRLGADKVIVVGHSWGSLLGLGVTKQRPDLVHAFVGVGQVLTWRKNFLESKRLLTLAAERAGDTETAKALKAIPDTWPPRGDEKVLDDYVWSFMKYLGDYGGDIWALKDTSSMMNSELIVDAIFSPDWSISELIGFVRGGASPATYALLDDLYGVDRLDDPGYYSFSVPIFIFQGEHDLRAPATLVKPWFARIEAPHKEYIAFEDSAHVVIIEEPAKYICSLISRVRPFAVKPTPTTIEE